METMTADRQEQYVRAVRMNDEAHRKSIREIDSEDFGDRQERFREIQQEARLWLRHLDSIYRRS